MAEKLKGVMVPVASPCDENDVFQEDLFIKLVESLIDTGIHGFYVCGGTGDGFKMRLDERKRAAEITFYHYCLTSIVLLQYKIQR